MKTNTISQAGTIAHLARGTSRPASFGRIRPTYIGWRTHLYGPELTTRWPRSLWMRTVVSRNGFTAMDQMMGAAPVSKRSNPAYEASADIDDQPNRTASRPATSGKAMRSRT